MALDFDMEFVYCELVKCSNDNTECDYAFIYPNSQSSQLTIIPILNHLNSQYNPFLIEWENQIMTGCGCCKS